MGFYLPGRGLVASLEVHSRVGHPLPGPAPQAPGGGLVAQPPGEEGAGAGARALDAEVLGGGVGGPGQRPAGVGTPGLGAPGPGGPRVTLHLVAGHLHQPPAPAVGRGWHQGAAQDEPGDQVN